AGGRRRLGGDWRAGGRGCGPRWRASTARSRAAMVGWRGAAATIAVMVGAGLAMVYPVDDLDVWWLLRSGAYMVETRSFPTVDPFSGPAYGAPWVNHAWAFELGLYGIYRLAGIPGLILLQALFAVATLAVPPGPHRRGGAAPPCAPGPGAAGAPAPPRVCGPPP